MTSTQTPRIEEALRAELAAQLLTARTGRASPGGPARPKGLKRLTEAPPPPPGVNHPAYAAEVVALIGAAAHAAQINPYWLVAGGGLAALSTGLNVHARYHHRPATTYAAVSSLAAGGIGAAIAEHGLVSGWGALALAGGMVGLGPVYGSLRRRHDKRTEKESLERKAEIAARKRSDWERILFDAGVKGIRIETELTDDEWTNGEQSFPIGSDSPAGFALAVELGRDSPEGSMLAGMTPRIEKEAARQLRLPIRSGAIRVEPRGYAHQWKLIIPTKDLLRETVPFVLEKGPRTINDPLYVAMSADGMALGVDFNTTPHGLVAGITGNGKTTFLNVHILESTRCVDTVNWYICGDKPTRVLRPWMEAFLNGTSSDVSGTGYVEPILDWIATDIQEACHMLLDAYKAVSIRQAMPAEPGASEEKWSPSRNRPRICIWMDEAPKFLTNNQYKVKTWDWTGSRTTEQEDAEGLPRTGYTFSELLLEVIRLARSEGISVVFMLQRPTNDMAGDSGGGLKSQLGYRTSFKQAGGLEQGKTFISDALGVDVKTLGIGELYMESGEVSRPILGKSYYAQWDDIRAATVAHTAYQQPLDPETAADLDFYAGRWTRQSTQDFLRTIVADPARSVPGQAGRNAEMAAEDSARQVPDVPASMAAGQIEAAAKGMDVSADELREMFPELRDLDDNGVPDSEEPPPPTPWGARMDPTLPDNARQLLDLLSSTDYVRHSEWITTAEIMELVDRELEGWPDNITEGGKWIRWALDQVDVIAPRKPPRKPESRDRYPQGYPTIEIRRAVERFRRTDEGESEPPT